MIALGVGISAALTISIVLHPLQKTATSFALLIGGAMSNVADRLTRGAVVDWLDFYLMRWHWPAFNIADMSIVVGALLLCLHAHYGEQPTP
ncbi:hypothetical protein GCM10011430_28190 [Oxalicibacterium solurbis]|uniref:Signal peptidase II n=1 Tax=Oxalicibacterium solurbis TaxID=69280 RepID=A0A8J3AYE8_9BURK|nr:hypothetical protein GCM10011430_28190 [Oxalicibacterium solurbis]